METVRYIATLRKKLDSQPQNHDPTSAKVRRLADTITAWHSHRSVPERWNPVQLGRLAAMFGVTREVAATALTLAGWREIRTNRCSYWQPSA